MLIRGCAVVRASEEAGRDAPAGTHCEARRGAEATGPARDGETSLSPSLSAIKFLGYDALMN